MNIEQLENVSPQELFDLAVEHEIDIWYLEAASRGGLPAYLDSSTKREDENWHHLNDLLEGNIKPDLTDPLLSITPKSWIERWKN